MPWSYTTLLLGDSTKFSLLASLNAVIGVLSVLTFPSLAQKFSRRKVFLFAITLMLLGMAIFACAGKSLLLILLGAVCFYIPQPLVFLVVLMIITDSVEYGQLKFGHRDESLILSVRPLLDKFGGAVSNGLVGLTAIWAGMTSGVSAKAITNQGQNIFKLMMFLLPALLICISLVIFISKVTLNETQHDQIVAELEKTWSPTN